MDHQAATQDWSSHQSRFEFAPPRHFLLPAILLLVSEKPGYGYSLVKDLQDFRFGQVERAGVYRALAQLEGDGLVKVWDEPAKAGQARRVYGITEHGARVLRAWMGVIKEERDCLDHVLHRYQATGTADAALAQVEGAWHAALGHAWSPVSSTCASGRRRPVSETSPGPTSLLMPSREDETARPGTAQGGRPAGVKAPGSNGVHGPAVVLPALAKAATPASTAGGAGAASGVGWASGVGGASGAGARGVSVGEGAGDRRGSRAGPVPGRPRPIGRADRSPFHGRPHTVRGHGPDR